MSPFANQVIVVTGAASGLGLVMTRRLLAEGAAVAAIDRNEDGLRALEREHAGKRLATKVADVTDAAGLAKAVHSLETELGPTDRLIANAGIGRPTGSHCFSTADFADIINVNLIGVANSVAAVLPGMIDRRRGHLVALSSLASYHGIPKMSAYCASKAGVSALFDSLAVELRQFDIAVSTICPGWIQTPLVEQVKFHMKGIMEPEYAVGRILDAVRQRRRYVAFPLRTTMLVRLLRWLPASWADRVVLATMRGGDAAEHA